MKNIPLASVKDLNRKTEFRYLTNQNLTEFLASLSQIKNDHKHDLTIHVQGNNTEANSISFMIEANNIRLTCLLIGQCELLEDGTRIITGAAGIKDFSFTSTVVSFLLIGLLLSFVYAQSNISLFFMIFAGIIVIGGVVIYGFHMYANYTMKCLLKILSDAVENK